MKDKIQFLLLFFALSVSGYAGLQNDTDIIYTKAGKVNIPIDFSCAGYEGGGVSLPVVGAVLTVKPSGLDDTRLLQTAIDYIGALPIGKDGFRGALQLSGGRYKISGQLHINKSGIVIRGSAETKKTVLIASGTDRRTLIEIRPEKESVSGPSVKITDNKAPEGSRTLTLENLKDFSIGDKIVITRPSTREWIADIGMDKNEGTFVDRRGLRWPIGSRDLTWDRVITSIDFTQKQITIDAPITTAIESIYGGGTIRKVIRDERIYHSGIENVELESEYDPANLFDEEHAWMAISINNAEDCWIYGVTTRHFVSSLVYVGQRGRRISIIDCRSEEPVSEEAGFRRQSFWIEGQQVLTQNCSAKSGMNDFAIGLCAGGPNVFLDCIATSALGPSGSGESWSSGTLFEDVKIEGSGIRLTFDFERAQAGGWTAANSFVWNCQADYLEVLGPYCAPNHIVESDSSLYFNQLKNRLGAKFIIDNELFNSPRRFSEKGKIREYKISDIQTDPPSQPSTIHQVEIVNGRFVKDGKIVWGGTNGDPYWKGQTTPNAGAGSSITRFVPGKEGNGLTEDLPEMMKRLVERGVSTYESVTGLWYDRRRDDHSISKRDNPDVWAPFFEMPWARSGQGKALDGLSLYDLTKFNPWYFKRCREFAELSDQNGIIFYFNFYNTHNLLEYLTHWVDYPWRPINNINKTGLPEPPEKEPWARMHIGNQFYDPTNAELSKLHKAYIFHTLDELGSVKNIFFKLANQYAGPFNFQRFFIETVHEWEVLHKTNVRLVLAASKDVTDAVLADPELASQIDVIDTRYWQYRSIASFSNGDDLWAPPGGQNRAFREMVGGSFILENDIPFPTTQEKMYKQVREYHDRYPEKAILSELNDISSIPSLMAGGAQVNGINMKDSRPGHLTFDNFINRYLSETLMLLEPNDNLLDHQKENWCLTDKNKKVMLIYSLKGTEIVFSDDVMGDIFSGLWYDPLTERVFPLDVKLNIRKGLKIVKPANYNLMLLLNAD